MTGSAGHRFLWRLLAVQLLELAGAFAGSAEGRVGRERYHSPLIQSIPFETVEKRVLNDVLKMLS